jgi:hypothetical protein
MKNIKEKEMENEGILNERSASAPRFTRSIINETPVNEKSNEIKEKSTGGGKKKLLPTFLPSQEGSVRRSLPESIIKYVSFFFVLSSLSAVLNLSQS